MALALPTPGLNLQLGPATKFTFLVLSTGWIESGETCLPTHCMIVIDAPARGRSIFPKRRRASLALRGRRHCR